MTKQLNIKIEKCEDCPYFKNVYNRCPGGTWTSSTEFICKKKEGYSHMQIDPDVFKQHNFLHADCPLSDARGQGVKVGVAIILLNEKNEFLVGRRDNATSGNDAWGLPGGGMDAGETPPESGGRELKEETDITVLDTDKLEFATFTNDCFMEESGEHWITLYYLCRPDNWVGEASRVEPHKCKEWRWVDVDNIPRPAFCDWATEPKLMLLKKMIENSQSSGKINLLNSSEDNLKAYY